MPAPAKRLLWVDDEIDLLRPHLLFMQGRGYHVDAVSNGDDALELLRLSPYDLVLLDEQMPGRSGMQVFDELRRLARSARKLEAPLTPAHWAAFREGYGDGWPPGLDLAQVPKEERERGR